MKKHFIILIFLTLISIGVLFLIHLQKERVRDNTYINKEYGFTFQIPDGWHLEDTDLNQGTLQLFNYRENEIRFAKSNAFNQFPNIAKIEAVITTDLQNIHSSEDQPGEIVEEKFIEINKLSATRVIIKYKNDIEVLDYSIPLSENNSLYLNIRMYGHNRDNFHILDDLVKNTIFFKPNNGIPLKTAAIDTSAVVKMSRDKIWLIMNGHKEKTIYETKKLGPETEDPNPTYKIYPIIQKRESLTNFIISEDNTKVLFSYVAATTSKSGEPIHAIGGFMAEEQFISLYNSNTNQIEFTKQMPPLSGENWILGSFYGPIFWHDNLVYFALPAYEGYGNLILFKNYQFDSYTKLNATTAGTTSPDKKLYVSVNSSEGGIGQETTTNIINILDIESGNEKTILKSPDQGFWINKWINNNEVLFTGYNGNDGSYSVIDVYTGKISRPSTDLN